MKGTAIAARAFLARSLPRGKIYPRRSRKSLIFAPGSLRCSKPGFPGVKHLLCLLGAMFVTIFIRSMYSIILIERKEVVTDTVDFDGSK